MKLFNLKNAAMILAMAMAVPFLQSCGDDEPETPDQNKPSESNSEFVGAWEGSMGDFVFFSDGYAKLLPKNGGNASFGKWTYGDDTKILATTVNNWQFVVTLTSDDEWAAIAASGSGTYSFEREDDEDLGYCVLRGATWTDENGESGTFESKLTYYRDGSSFNSDFVYALGGYYDDKGYILLQEDNDGNDNTFRYWVYRSEYKYLPNNNSYYYFQQQHRGTAKFTDMTSATKCKLEITSDDKNPENRVHHVYTINNTAAAAK